MSKVLIFTGILSLIHCGYSAAQYRSHLRLIGQEFDGFLPVDIIFQALFSFFVSLLGVVQLCNGFKEIRALNELQSKTCETLENRPSFYTFNHRAPPEPNGFDPECFVTNTECKEDNCPKEIVSRCSAKLLSDSHVAPYHCYVVWKNTTEGVEVKLRGCVSGKDFTCSNSSSCIERNRSTKNGLFFCCCSTDLCNENFLHLPAEEVNRVELAPPQPTAPSSFDPDLFWIFICILIPSIFILGIILIISWYQRNKSRAFNEELSNNDESSPIFEQSFFRFKNLELVGEQSRGRFGSVWKARLPSENDFIDEKWVAVKIFPAHEKHSWLTEQQVFMLPKFEHKNILPFLGFEKRVNDAVPFGIEYWIISEFHELGSLYDYLRSNTIEYNDLLKMSEGIVCGLAHLHDEIPSSKSGHNKPAIAHRDFKSKNVLLKSDLTPRIADFGLCLVFYPDRIPTDLGQVGTRRYMAPEVLEGAITFYRDSLTRIDMYACGLVLWELLSRCTGEDGTIVPDKYMLPFEEDVGFNPSLEDMQEVVCSMKKRPTIKPTWLSYPALSQICETIEECWDQDAEARLSASCVLERITHLMKTLRPVTDE